MDKLKIILFLSLFFMHLSCSKSSKKADPSDSTESVSKETDQTEKSGDESDPSLAEADLEEDEEELIIEEEDEEMGVAKKDENSNVPTEDLEELQVAGGAKEYKVKKGETLMLIAFKLFGDYGKWKEIVAQNPEIKTTGLVSGTSIKYISTGKAFDWRPEGLPHLIKSGDTLGKISDEKYGTPKRWKYIWENNKPLIKDPNLIYAGFTLYYKPDGKELASW
jgi:nucleoid-associated protein YgaU